MGFIVYFLVECLINGCIYVEPLIWPLINTQCFAQGHFHMWTGRVDPTTNSVDELVTIMSAYHALPDISLV